MEPALMTAPSLLAVLHDDKENLAVHHFLFGLHSGKNTFEPNYFARWPKSYTVFCTILFSFRLILFIVEYAYFQIIEYHEL